MHYLISIMYDGSKFYGFQRLKNQPTVQKSLEDALSLIDKQQVTIKGAGRTDRFVHAYDQKASFTLYHNIPPLRLKNALNSSLMPYIYITDVLEVPKYFHARFDVVKKEYIYKINLGPYNPLFADYVFTPSYPLNIKALKKCAKLFLGVHNFQNFVSSTRPNYEAIIYNITFTKRKSILEIKFTGCSFYRYMVRNLVGAMLDVSTGKTTLSCVQETLLNPTTKKQFSTATPKGLYLNKVTYNLKKTKKS